jgi:Nuclear pore localisation protein NPL4
MLNITLQLIRVRSKDGNFRFELSPDNDISVLLAKVSDVYLISVLELICFLDSRNHGGRGCLQLYNL